MEVHNNIKKNIEKLFDNIFYKRKIIFFEESLRSNLGIIFLLFYI
jgi:hypothetical protein